MKTLDFRYMNASHPERADANIVLIAIDQNSIDFFSSQRMSWPWPREFYALLLDYLRAGGAKLVALDYDFSQHDIERLEIDASDSDQLFAKPISRSGNAILGAHLLVHEKGDQTGSIIIPRFAAQGGFKQLITPQFGRASAPLPDFQNAAAGLGIFNFENDVDGIARRVPLVYQFGNNYLPYFGLACYSLAQNIPLDMLDSLVRTIPLSNDGRFLFYFLSALITLALSLSVVIIFFRLKNILAAVLYILLAGFIYFAAVWLFSASMIWLPVVCPEIALIVTFALSAVVSYATEGKQKREMRKAFNRYLNPHVVTEILGNPDAVGLGGKLNEGTVYFSDIKNFSNYSDKNKSARR